MIDKILVASMGMEGGGISIYGREDGGVWSFWEEGSSIDLDENDDDVWRSWSSDPVSELDRVLPQDWPVYYPTTIHLMVLDWFRRSYEDARSGLPPDQRRYQEEHRHRRWLEILGEGA